jgi:hypothetical protein
MKLFTPFVLFTALAAGAATFAVSAVSAAEMTPAAPEKPKKNWTPPATKIYAQTLVEQMMAAHPEFQSVTFHGVPPGLKDVYTMFAGSYLDRIGNPDDPDDVDVIVKGITTVDPRWHKLHDPVKKFVMMLPLRDASGENVGLLVIAYKLESPINAGRGEREYFLDSMAVRDALAKQIPSYADLFKPAP